MHNNLQPLNWSTRKCGFVILAEEDNTLRNAATSGEIGGKLVPVNGLGQQGDRMADAVRAAVTTEVTFYRWHKEHGA